MNMRLFTYAKEIRSAVLMIHGDKAHSCYMSRDAYANMVEDSRFAGNKELLKDYTRYSGFRGGLKHFTAAQMREKHPERMIMEAVWGMLPKNNIARKMMTRLKVFAGAEHTHAAQKPVEINI